MSTQKIISNRRTKNEDTPVKKESRYSQYIKKDNNEYVKKFNPDPWLESRIDRTLKHYQHQSFTYIPQIYQDIRQDRVELMSLNLQEKYGEKCIRYSLTSLSRVKIPKGSFEINEEGGELDNKRDTCLCFELDVKIANPNSVRLGVPKEKSLMSTTDTAGASDVQFKVGRYSGIVPQYKHDMNTGEIIDAKISGHVDRFYIPDTAANIRKVIKLYGEPKQGYSVKRASNPMVAWRIPNFDEFVSEDIELLIGARSKDLLHETKGGVSNYKRWLKLEESIIKSGESSKPELDKISKEDIVKLLKSKKEEQ